MKTITVSGYQYTQTKLGYNYVMTGEPTRDDLHCTVCSSYIGRQAPPIIYTRHNFESYLNRYCVEVSENVYRRVCRDTTCRELYCLMPNLYKA